MVDGREVWRTTIHALHSLPTQWKWLLQSTGRVVVGACAEIGLLWRTVMVDIGSHGYQVHLSESAQMTQSRVAWLQQRDSQNAMSILSRIDPTEQCIFWGGLS